MASKREQVLGALFARLGRGLSAMVRRNEALPEHVPPEGLVILRDGDPGEPDVALNPRTEFHSHRVEIKALVIRGPDGGGETVLDALIDEISAALDIDSSLGGLAENVRLGPPDVGGLSIEGAVPNLTARLLLAVDYLTGPAA
jgi:hypothetical protein